MSAPGPFGLDGPSLTGDELPGAEFHARGLREIYWLSLALGLGGLALAAAIESFHTPFAILVFAVATRLGVAGLLDRRVKLTV